MIFKKWLQECTDLDGDIRLWLSIGIGYSRKFYPSRGISVPLLPTSYYLQFQNPTWCVGGGGHSAQSWVFLPLLDVTWSQDRETGERLWETALGSWGKVL